MQKKYFPVLIDITQKKCLVIGGGGISYRKIQNLLEFNADVTCLSPMFCPQIEELIAGNVIKSIKREYYEDAIKDYDIVFSATGNMEVEFQIKKDCNKHKILLNVADVPDLCDFIMPATIKKGNITVSIASQGKSPFLVKKLKGEILNSLNPFLEEISELAEEFRNLIISNKNLSQEQQNKLFNDFYNVDWQIIINSQGKEQAMNKMKELINFELCK